LRHDLGIVEGNLVQEENEVQDTRKNIECKKKNVISMICAKVLISSVIRLKIIDILILG